VKIKNKEIGSNFKPLMIAEEGQANQGDLNIALKMANLASEAGADGIEYQLFFADEMYAKYDEGYNLYKERELCRDEIKDLLKETHSLGLISQIAGLSPKIIELCSKFDADIFVVNATDLNNPEIIDAVISSGKPFWFATLMGSLSEIDWAVEYALSKNASSFGLLHGQHVMSNANGQGVDPEYLQLDCIELLEKRYKLPVGFVDHTSTKIVPALAVAKGACIVTKHLSPYKSWVGPDSKICLDPATWKEAKDFFDYADKAKGNSKELSIAELKDKSLFRRSIHTTKMLKSGTKLVRSDLIALRPGSRGINPSLIQDLIGLELLVNLDENQQIKPEDIRNFYKKN
jgi:sialic acid synthase SpsE